MTPNNKPRRRLWGWLLALSLWMAVAGRAAAADSKPTELTVSAAASLENALEEVQQLYAHEKPSAKIIYNFGASGTLQLQIEQGAPVDIFLSAAPMQMDALEAKGLLLAGTRKNLLKNRLVLIVPRNGAGISSFQDLARDRVQRVALGEPRSVPAGKYAEEVLTHLRIYAQVRPKTVLAGNVRQVLAFVETGNVDAGIVYATDAALSRRVRVVAEAPEDSHAPVVYPVGVLKDTKSPSAAKEFVRFLRGPQARAVFEKYGFRMAGE